MGAVTAVAEGVWAHIGSLLILGQGGGVGGGWRGGGENGGGGGGLGTHWKPLNTSTFKTLARAAK